ncbi:hypothetical protein [Duganella sacchari]|nr:hypothetical protein [Duganella sacchari]
MFELDEFSWLNANDVIAFLQPAIDFYNGRRVSTQKNYMSKLRLFGKEMRRLGVNALPEGEEAWQTFIFDAFTIWMTRACKATISSNAGVWDSIIRPFLQLLRDVADLIPLGVIVPDASQAVTDDISSEDSLIGNVNPEEVSRTDQLVVTIDLERSDAEYLDELRDELVHRSSILEQCCLAWWEQVEQHYRYGADLIAGTNWQGLLERLMSGKYLDPQFGRRGGARFHFANGRSKESLGNLLSILAKLHGRNTNKALIEKTASLPCYSCIRIPNSAPETVSPLVTLRQRLNWMLGNLCATDYSCAMVLLTMNHPKFTTSSLLKAKLKDKNGHPYVEVDDFGTSFRIDKHRANTIKSETLSVHCESILNLIIEMTSHRRDELSRIQSPFANSLFLIGNRSQIMPLDPTHATSFLSGWPWMNSRAERRWLGSYFPQLEKAGISQGTLTLRRVRATQGVLAWFSSGSAESMARTLGNTAAVSVENYLPRALLNAWNTRQLRRFQNIWLSVAAANESYQVTATDFSDLSALNSFLLRAIEILPNGSSPLANELHERLQRSISGQSSTQLPEGALSIPASKNCLLALYLYKEAAALAGISPSALRTIDISTGICPNDIITLSDLVRSRAIEDRNPKVRQAHENAVKELPEIMARTNWQHLFARWGNNYEQLPE